MLKNPRKISFTLVLGTILGNILVGGAIADDDKPAPASKPEEASIAEDDISTRKGMPWGGGKFPYSQTLTIRDSLVSTPVGMVIVDKHGIDDSKSGGGDSLESSLLGALIPIESPFSAPVPGKSVFITLWGSKIEGCFVEAIVQVAPDREIVAKSIAPTMLELGVNNQIIQLAPQNTKPKIGSFAYKYTVNKQKRDAKWYMARQIFAIDAGTAKLLSDAPAQEVKARLDFGDDDSMIIPIGKGTVQGWKKAYSFNPACSANKK